MKHNAVLSSEQALDEYFSALLDEAAEELELAQEKDNEVVDLVYQENELVPQLKPKASPSLPSEEPVLLSHSNLDDVQRLLNQLESEPVSEHAEALIEQNTLDIQSVEPLVETEPVVDTVIEATDEIQTWEVAPVTVEPTVTAEVASVESDEKVEEIEKVADNSVEVQLDDDAIRAPTSVGDLTQWHGVQRTSDFQVLYFDVNGVNFAVALDELGGIHRIETLNHIIGKPKWYLGLQTNRDCQLDVVDTACWVMADKLVDDGYKQSYQYIVMLGDSMWGLAAGELKGTESLSCDKVRWREHVGKRPWLAGMVKEKMCALIHVEALVAMLNAGLDVKALDNDE